MSAIISLLTACSDDSENTTEQGEIRLKTDIWQMMEGSRATIIDSDTKLQGQDIKIDAYYNGTETAYLNGVKLHYDVSAWKFWDGSAQLHYYWPIEGSVYDPASANITVSSLDFVGFCPYSAPGYITATDYDASDGVSFTCNMASYMTLAAQEDVPECLVAVLNAQTYATQSDAGGALPLQFKHPFALVKFAITAASGTNVKINSVSIADLYTAATCTYDGSTTTWSSLSGSATMTLTEELENGATTEGTPFIVIPNNYGTKTITVNATWDDWSSVTTDVSASVSINWQAGTSYTYNLTLSKYALKVDTETFTEQW